MPPRQRLRSKPHAYLERDAEGRFKHWESVRRAEQEERYTRAEHNVKPGYGGQGDIGLRHGYVVATREAKGRYENVTGIVPLKTARKIRKRLRRENPGRHFRIFKV